MDVQFFKDWGGVVATFISIGGFFYAWLTAGSKTNAAELDKLEARMASVETKLTKIETDMEHLPDEKALTDLKLELADMRGSFGRMEESVSAISRTVHRVEEYLLKKGTA